MTDSPWSRFISYTSRSPFLNVRDGRYSEKLLKFGDGEVRVCEDPA